MINSKRPLGLVLAACIAFLFTASARAAPEVGYQYLTMLDPFGPPVEVGVWYPTTTAPSLHRLQLFEQTVAQDAPLAGRALPLVVISHGNGASFASHYDTAIALARAGYVVASLTHTGDNYRDQSRAVDMANRPRQLELLIQFMLSGWKDASSLNPQRIGAFGFSSGGFTVLTLAGAEPDLAAFGPHCADHAAFYDCALLNRFPSVAGRSAMSHPIWTHDERLKAVVSAAPALSFAFGKSGLTGVHAPIQLWAAEFDHVLPPADYTEVVRRDLATAPEFHLAPNADHYDFLAPCSDALRTVAPDICTSRKGFHRERFHQTFNQKLVAFFDDHLKGG